MTPADPTLCRCASAPPQAPALEPLAVDAKVAARLCGVSRSLWFSMDSAAQIPMGCRLGRRRVWPLDELKDWLRAGCPSRDRWAAMKGGRR
jgi:predicted DNA-binding transcriptional regulator AlpA